MGQPLYVMGKPTDPDQRGRVLCPWEPAGDHHRLVFLAASFGDDGVLEVLKCEACPRALKLRNGVIASAALPVHISL